MLDASSPRLPLVASLASRNEWPTDLRRGYGRSPRHRHLQQHGAGAAGLPQRAAQPDRRPDRPRRGTVPGPRRHDAAGVRLAGRSDRQPVARAVQRRLQPGLHGAGGRRRRRDGPVPPVPHPVRSRGGRLGRLSSAGSHALQHGERRPFGHVHGHLLLLRSARADHRAGAGGARSGPGGAQRDLLARAPGGAGADLHGVRDGAAASPCGARPAGACRRGSGRCPGSAGPPPGTGARRRRRTAGAGVRQPFLGRVRHDGVPAAPVEPAGIQLLGSGACQRAVPARGRRHGGHGGGLGRSLGPSSGRLPDHAVGFPAAGAGAGIRRPHLRRRRAVRSLARGVALHPDRHGPGAVALAPRSGFGNGSRLPVRDGGARHLGNRSARRSFRTDFRAAGRRRRRPRVRLRFPAPAETGTGSTGGGARRLDRARRGVRRPGAALAAPGGRGPERRDQRPGARRRDRRPAAGRRDQDRGRSVAQHPVRSRRPRRQLPGAGPASGRLLRRGDPGRLRDLRRREPDPGRRRRAAGRLPDAGRQRLGARPRLLAAARRRHRQRRQRARRRRPAAVAGRRWRR